MELTGLAIEAIGKLAEETRAAALPDADGQILTRKQIREAVEKFGGKLQPVDNDADMAVTKDDDGESGFTIKHSSKIEWDDDAGDMVVALDVLHELAHVIFVSPKWSTLSKTWSKSCAGYSDEDYKCDIFARAFLMPKKEFVDAVFENTLDGTCNVLAVAQKFNVYYERVIRRGADLKLW